MSTDDVLVVIPARYRSSRLPGKPLLDLAGKPMIVRTAERCLEVVPPDRLLVATDDDRVADVCTAHGLRVEMTRDDHPTGTDRVAEIAERISAMTYINVQGDEPVFNPDDLRLLIDASRADPTVTHIGFCHMTEEQWRDPKYTRLLFGLGGQLIYIGRARVPGSHDDSFRVAFRQVCLHAFPKDALASFAATHGRTPLEAIEDHEMMRFLELGLPVKVIEMSADSIPVDRPGDVPAVLERLVELGTAH